MALAALALALCAGVPARAETIELKSIETPDIRLLYTPEQAYLAPYAARTFLNSLKFQRRIFGWDPDGKIYVILTDLSDYNNGGASATPINGVTVYIAPDSHTLETTPGNERMFMLANHELVHVATMDGWAPADKAWRGFFFGKPRQTDAHPETILYNYLTVPRLSVPRWYLEGSASFMETWMSGGFGRAQGAYDEMVFRAMVRDGTRFYDPLGLVSAGTAADFQTMSTAYLYGTRFVTYLALRESPEKVIAWLRRDADSKRYYADQFKHVFGKPLEQAWREWITWEAAFQKANLEQVRRYPLTKGRPLVPQGLGSVSKSYVDAASRSLVGAFYYPGVLPHVGTVSLADGVTRRLADIKGPMKYRVTSTAFDPQARTLFYTEDNLAYRDLMALDLATGARRELLRDARIGDLAFNPADRSLWGLRHDNGYVTLVRIPYPYTDFNQLHTYAYGVVPFDLDISPDGKLLSASVGEISGEHFLRVFRTQDLMDRKIEHQKQFDFGQSIPEGFVFSPDGKYLYGSAYYTGVSNIYRYEVANGELEAVSNAETGFFRPIPQEDGSLIVLEHTGQGFVPTVIEPKVLKDLGTVTFLGNELAKTQPVVMTWGAGSPDSVDLEAAKTSEQPYRPFNEIRFQSAYPVAQGYRNVVAAGWHFDFADPLGLESLGVTASYSPARSLGTGERLHLDVDYKSLYWRARYWHNHASFYDLSGPTKRSLRGNAFLLDYRLPLLYDEPRRLDFDAQVARYTGLLTAPGNQNVLASATALTRAKAGWTYTDTYRSANSVDHESGYRWNADFAASKAATETSGSARGGFDFGFPLPLPHASLWLYSSAGASSGRRSDSLANFYFGGFQNNRIDNGEVKRYRQYDTFPGFQIDDLSGQSFAKTVLELNLPPVRFESIGTPGFYLSSMRPAVFAGVLVTDPAKPQFRQTARNFGGQLDFNFNVLHRLPMTLSAGYARGWQQNQKASHEWMLSLKILGT
ncbi:MAG: hypothetical protein JWQ07_3189 [Ramlibacter sp.]|nr:hypothetical protein [Ramlibacter sp.]